MSFYREMQRLDEECRAKSDRIEELDNQLIALQQTSAELCPDCGWSFQIPGEECYKCGYERLEKQLEASNRQWDVFESRHDKIVQGLDDRIEELEQQLQQSEYITKTSIINVSADRISELQQQNCKLIEDLKKKHYELANYRTENKSKVNLMKQNAKLVEALEFYAAPESYCIDLSRMEACVAVAVDNGKIAADALKGIRDE